MTEPPETLLEFFGTISTPVVSDSIEACGYPAGAAGPGLLPLHQDGDTRVGLAHTAFVEPTSQRVEIDELLRYVEAAQPHSFAVVGSEPGIPCAIWGGLMSTTVQRRGCVAAAVDGPVRDLRQIGDLDFPVWALGRSPLDIRGRGKVTSLGEPIVFRGLRIAPGQMLVADANGLVAIPFGAEHAVAEACRARVSKEQLTEEQIRSGAAPSEVYAEHGTF